MRTWQQRTTISVCPHSTVFPQYLGLNQKYCIVLLKIYWIQGLKIIKSNFTQSSLWENGNLLLFSSHYPHFPALARSLDQCYEAGRRQSTNSQQINREKMKRLSMLNFFYRSERYCLCRNWFSCLLCLGLGLGPPGALKPTNYSKDFCQIGRIAKEREPRNWSFCSPFPKVFL